jgi:hypothetical protein
MMPSASFVIVLMLTVYAPASVARVAPCAMSD